MTALLLDHFYKIDTLESTDGGLTAQVTFDAAHPIFQGHFPDMPVVPGVCETQMVGEVLSKALGTDLVLKTAATIKFLSVVDPIKTPKINMILTYTKTENTYAVSAQYKWEETVFFKLKGTYA